ncbi:hypothetical protein GG804_24930 [Sphingomonas histidinilytica]|uniref:hypothetical protein n=1 Tax=Rhizorhabdus histidinilytica TaxID=439228 RepID=UPI001AD983FF|nr:hypothetical protein [Rhizorhabdus histidinilytica]MBO9380016.1 hypothetical protein [Rhizorhabdus histidinilytica]
MSNVVQFRRPATKPAYAPGVVPFDSNNPSHIEAWNALFEFRTVAQRYQVDEDRS